MVPYRFVVCLLSAFALSPPVHAQTVELLDFYLPTCGPCREMEPTVARLEAAGVRVRRVNGSRESGLAAKLSVDRYPTFVAIADGQEVGRRVGMASYEDLLQMVSSQQPASRSVVPTRQTFAEGGKIAPVGGDWGAGSPVAVSSSQPSESSGELLRYGVRFTVKEGSAVSHGTGTIVDARSGEALVVTCAHLFVDQDGRPLNVEGNVEVELFDASARVVERVAGRVISHDAESDVALVAIRPQSVVKPAAVAASPGDIRVGDNVSSVGCDLGADPTIRTHQVVDRNRYLGPPNTEASGAPVQGRSGGGLFNAAGELIGVCNFADEAADEGIYAGLESIHAQLDRIGLQELYRAKGAATPPPAAFAAAPPKVSREPVAPILRGQNAIAPPQASGAPSAVLSDVERATLNEIGARAQGADVTIVIHPEGGGSEVLTLDTASPEFVAALRRLAERR